MSETLKPMTGAHVSSQVQILGIDANNLAYASAFVPAFQEMSFRGAATGVVYGTLQSVQAALRRHPNALPLVLWDGRAHWRFALYPSYKSNRDDTEEKIQIRESVRKQSIVVRRVLEALGIAQACHLDAEADDLAGMLARACPEHRMRLRLTTSDTDWWQALSPWVDWESPRDFSLVSHQGFSAITKDAPTGGWKDPQEYLQAKILAGDISDSIKGVEKVGLKVGAKILRTAEGGLRGVLEGNFSAKGAVADRLRTEASREMVLRNARLMDWNQAPLGSRRRLALWRQAPDMRKVQDVLDGQGLFRMRQEIEPYRGEHEDPQAWFTVLCALDTPELYLQERTAVC